MRIIKKEGVSLGDTPEAIERAFKEAYDIEVEVEQERDWGVVYFEVESRKPNDSGEHEWYVFLSEDDAEDFARQLVKQDLEDEPFELFTRDWLMNFVYVSDVDRRILADQEANLRTQDMDDEELLNRADLLSDWEDIEDQITELEDSKEDNAREISDLRTDQADLIDQAREEVGEEIYNEWYDGLEDPIEFLVNEYGIYSLSELSELLFIRINVSEAAEDAIRVDGIAHFLDRYDGVEEIITDPETKQDFLIYGTN